MKRFLRTAGASVPARYAGYVSRLPDEERTQLYAAALRDLVPVGAAEQRFAAAFRDGGSPTGVRAALYLDYKTYLPDDILMLADRMSMAHSLELRVPFVDHRFVEEAYPLPDRQRVGLGRSKRLLRRALRARLPQAHFSAPKRGFVGPTAAWLRKELRDVLCDELSAARMTRLGFFDPATVQGLLDDHFERRHNREGILWALLCFSTWHRLFVETPSARPYQPGR
jgi:asparagine synthase (glutamine-hydrolysing)